MMLVNVNAVFNLVLVDGESECSSLCLSRKVFFFSFFSVTGILSISRLITVLLLDTHVSEILS